MKRMNGPTDRRSPELGWSDPNVRVMGEQIEGVWFKGLPSHSRRCA